MDSPTPFNAYADALTAARAASDVENSARLIRALERIADALERPTYAPNFVAKPHGTDTYRTYDTGPYRPYAHHGSGYFTHPPGHGHGLAGVSGGGQSHAVVGEPGNSHAVDYGPTRAIPTHEPLAHWGGANIAHRARL